MIPSFSLPVHLLLLLDRASTVHIPHNPALHVASSADNYGEQPLRDDIAPGQTLAQNVHESDIRDPTLLTERDHQEVTARYY